MIQKSGCEIREGNSMNEPQSNRNREDRVDNLIVQCSSGGETGNKSLQEHHQVHS